MANQPRFHARLRGAGEEENSYFLGSTPLQKAIDTQLPNPAWARACGGVPPWAEIRTATEHQNERTPGAAAIAHTPPVRHSYVTGHTHPYRPLSCIFCRPVSWCNTSLPRGGTALSCSLLGGSFMPTQQRCCQQRPAVSGSRVRASRVTPSNSTRQLLACPCGCNAGIVRIWWSQLRSWSPRSLETRRPRRAVLGRKPMWCGRRTRLRLVGEFRYMASAVCVVHGTGTST